MLLCRALAVLVLVVWSSTAAAQSLGEIARKIEQSRRADTPGSVTYDARDMNPALARSELLGFRFDQERWQRFLHVDRAVGRTLAADASIMRRLEGLNSSSLRSLGHFFQREAAVRTALDSVAADPHDYATAYLAAKLALSSLPDALDRVVTANAAFLKSRQPDVRRLAISLDKLSLHALRPPPPRPSSAAPAALPAATRSDAPVPIRAEPPDATGAIDMSEGAQIPDFDFVDFEGRRRQLSDFRGRYVMLDFWGSWCPPCRAEVPFVKDAYVRFGSRGFEVLAMDSERDATVDQVRHYLSSNGVKWTFATPDSVRTLIDERFRIESFPRVILLDPSGRVIESRNDALRGENLALTLDRLLPK
jgi:thiol-disulfide isomerase/thioredoxin